MPSDLPPFRVSFEEQAFVNLPITTAQSSVVPVVVIQGDSFLCTGSAFTIASFGVMLTAKHVVEAALEEARGDNALIAVLHIASGIGHDVPSLLGGPLPIIRACLSGSTDLAVLQVQLPLLNDEPLNLPAFRLSPGLPQPGTRTMTFGYSRFRAQTLGHGPKESAFELSQDFSASDGRIVAVHPLRHDSVMRPFPCFESDARYDSGMSGGPVFSLNGCVCGVVCSGYDLGPEAVGFTSYASLVGPAFELEVLIANEAGDEATVSVLELATRGFVATDDTMPRFELRDNHDGTHEFRYYS